MCESRHMRPKGVLCLGFALGLVVALGCSSTPKSDCNDGIDNDGDGLIDEADPGCAFNMDRTEAPNPAQCNDGLDNDGDGLIDTADPGCDSGTDDDETDPIRACNNGMDDDGDALIDFPMDPGCDGPLDNDEFNPLQCQDFMDNDGDGIIDYPFDPGCESMTDNDETDPVPEPQCSDGIDNDFDGMTDYPADPGCGAAGDNDEFNVVIGACGPSVVINDITTTKMATGSITMALPNELTSPMCHGYGGEFAYTYTVASGPVALLVTTDLPETTLDTVVYVRTNCRQDVTELGCNDDGGQGDMGMMTSVHGSTLLLPLVNTGTYYIIVDSFGPGSLGDFKLSVTERNPLHGMCDATDPTSCIPGLICRAVTPGGPTTCEEHVCTDGVDNDADGRIDYPNDPGCATPSGDSEADPSPEPQCADGIDNDTDGLTDFPADPGCEAAADNVELDECFPGKAVNYFDPVAGVTGTTSGATDSAIGSCFASSTGGPDLVYALNVPASLTSVTVSSDNAMTTYDTALYVRDNVCATGTEVACNDNVSGGDTKSTVTWTPMAGHTYFVFVDGPWSASGAFHLTVSGTIGPGGACTPGDLQFTCPTGYACTGTCVPALCNDGLDNDADGRIDYPNDPGCMSTQDNDETDPSPEPQCGDGLDNDGDGFIDYPADSSCSSASDDNESCTSFGTDTYGYTGCYDSPGVMPCEDIHTTGLVSCLGDDCTMSVPIGFTFNYYGTSATTLNLISNGKLDFTAFGDTSYSNTCTIASNTIAAYWDDLYAPSGGTIRYQTFGTAPNRHFTAQWNVPHISGGTNYDIRATLYEGTNNIDICYVNTVTLGATTDMGASATIGIMGPAAAGIQYECDMPTATNGIVLHFIHP